MMITARRAMPPRIKAIELVVPVIGRSYSPAFLGWFSAMLDSFPWTAEILDKVKDGTWNPEDNNPADNMDPLGGLFDQFLGPDGLGGLGDLFGLGPGGSAPDDPSGGSDIADQLLRELLDAFMGELAPRRRSRHPRRRRIPSPRRRVRTTRPPTRSTA